MGGGSFKKNFLNQGRKSWLRSHLVASLELLNYCILVTYAL